MNDKKGDEKVFLYTPKLRATSTIKRKSIHVTENPSRINPPQESENDDSLGILSLRSLDISVPRDCDERRLSSSVHLQQQRMLAKSTLNKASSKVSALPSQFLLPSDSLLNNKSEFKYLNSESTIDEADLLSFNPSDISTPRSSQHAVPNSVNEQVKNATSFKSDGQILGDISQKIKISDVNDDMFELLNMQSFNLNHNMDRNSLSFIPAELAADKLIADEISWRNEKDIPGRRSEYFENSDYSARFSDKISMGQFFKEKSDDIEKIISASSPEKTNDPVPLIDSSITFNENDNSAEHKKGNSLSVSAIAKIVSAMNTCDTPRKIVDYLYEQGGHYKAESKTNNITSFEQVRNSSYKFSSSIGKENFNSLNMVKSITMSPNDSSSDDSTKTCSIKSCNVQMSESKESRSETGSDGILNSVRSASSLSNLPNGRLPIESNRTELIWGCVKLGKSQTQEFILRNRSQYRLKLQATVTGSSFKILKDHSELESLSSVRLMLHPMETRTIFVAFSPTSVGSAIEKILFTPLDKKLEQTKCQLVKLYGYGGHASLDTSNLLKDISGKCWLSLGTIESASEADQYFIVRNSGVLPGFVSMTIESKKLYSFSNIVISPNDFVLGPQEEQKVNVKYIPTKDDLKYIQNKVESLVIDIASIKLVTGAEVTRGRIRRLCRKAEEKQLNVHYLHKKISEKFNGEHMPSDLLRFKETISSMKELSQHCLLKEIVLTLEQDLESTLIAGIDETTMFQTLCPDNSNITILECTTPTGKLNNRTIKIEPTQVVLTPPYKMDDTILFTSDIYHSVKFNIITAPEQGLIVHPKEGVILPGETIILKISFKDMRVKQNKTHKISVYFENDVIEIDVKIIFIQNNDKI